MAASSDPNQVPAKVAVYLGDLGKTLAESAKRNGRTLNEEIRERLRKSLADDSAKKSK